MLCDISGIDDDGELIYLESSEVSELLEIFNGNNVVFYRTRFKPSPLFLFTIAEPDDLVREKLMLLTLTKSKYVVSFHQSVNDLAYSMDVDMVTFLKRHRVVTNKEMEL